MSNSQDYQTIISLLNRITPLEPKIYFRVNSKDILIVWEGTIPDEKTVSEIYSVLLRKVGTVIPNHYREFNFVSFTVLR